MVRSLKRRLLLATLIPGVATGLFVAWYELGARRDHDRWRADYDAEGLLGRITVAADDPLLLWEYRPNTRHEWLRTNEHGFREGQTSASKPEGQYRVAFVGDSVVLGWGVPLEQTFVRLLETTPPGHWPDPVQTLNFGIDGYQAAQIARLLETRVLDFDPDRVVYVLCPNDFDFEDSSARKLDYFAPPRSFLWRRLDRGLRNRLSSRQDFHLRHYDRRREEVFEAIVAMKDACKHHGCTFELVVMPAFYDAPDFSDYPLDEIHGGLRDLARRHDFPSRDLLAALRATGLAPRQLAQDPWHLLSQGHRHVAEALRAGE